MRIFRPGFLLLPACLCLLGSSPKTCDSIFESEEQGKFQQAADVYQKIGPGSCKIGEVHVAKLKALATIEKSIEANPHLMNAERAQDLRAFLKMLDTQQEQHLVQGAYVLLDKLSANAQSVADSPFGRFVREFRQSLHNRNPGQLPLAPAQTLASQLFALCIRCFAVFAIFAFGFWRLWPRKGIQISFEEITAKESKKPALDRVLMQEVQQAFWIPRTELTESGPEDLELAPVKDNNASGFGNLVPQRPLIPWADVVQSGIPLKVGPITFDLKQLFLFLLSPLQIRRRYSLIGFVHESNEYTFVTAQEVDWKGRQLRGRSWKAERQPNGTRREMIQDLTAQIIVDLRVSEITTDWRSYRYFCRGLDSLTKASAVGSRGQCECIESARDQFQMALACDPGNWMARFYLAISLCRCGENEIAVNHFSILERILSESDVLLGRPSHRLSGRSRQLRRPSQSSNSLVRHLWQYPQCPFLVLYNRAMALSGTLRSGALKEALVTVEKIEQAVELQPDYDGPFTNCAERLTSVDKNRFAMLALSARASILAIQTEHELHCPNAGPKLSELRRKIDATVDKFLLQFKQSQPALLSAHALAQATMLNAKGRGAFADFSVGHESSLTRAARTCFEEAAACLPDLIDSYLNLAKLYLHAKHEVSPNWIAEAGKQLRIAQRVAPDNIQVAYLQAKLASADEVRSYADALSVLTPVPDSPEKYFLRAEILSNPLFVEHNIHAAMEAWQKAVSLLSEPNQAEVEHLLYLFKLTRQSPELANVLCPVATEGAQRLGKGGKCTPDRALGDSWFDELNGCLVAA